MPTDPNGPWIETAGHSALDGIHAGRRQSRRYLAKVGVAGSNPVVRSTRTHHEARSASQWSGLDPEEPYSTREAEALLSPGLVPSLRRDVVLSHPSVSS